MSERLDITWTALKSLIDGTSDSLPYFYVGPDATDNSPYPIGKVVAVDGSIAFSAKVAEGLADHQDYVANFAGKSAPVSAAADDQGVTLARPYPGPLSYEQCERDFKILTCTVGQASVEDLKINPATLKEEDWAGPELQQVAVYKDVAGVMTPCADQADATANGILSVWDYKAYDQKDGTTQIPYAVRNGALVPDPAIPNAERFDHRAYVVVVPDLGQNYFVRLFDGYVIGRPVEGELSTEAPMARALDPALAPGMSNVLRVYIYHPVGQVNSHILWLLTYRPSGTF